MSKNREPELTPIITSQSNPIYIDSESTPHQGKYLNTVASISRLPAFDKNDNLTNLLYSKFIVKGVRPINYEAIVQKIRRNSDAKTERKVTRQTTNCTKEVKISQRGNQRESSSHCRNSQEQGDIFDFSMEKYLNRKDKSLTNLGNKYQRPSSGFQRSSSKSSFNRPQSAVPKSASLKLFTRPQSAIGIDRPISASVTSRKQENKRPQSSFQRTPGKKHSTYEYNLQKSSKILTISQSSPNINTIDFIQKNKREASLHKKSIYLTSASGGTNLQTLQQAQKREEEQKMQLFQKQLKSQRQIVTKKEKALITRKQKEYLAYMKEHMPMQYKECIDFIAGQSQIDQEAKSLCSCGLGEEEPIDMTTKEVEEFEVQQFYTDFLNKCLNLEHNIKKAQLKKPQQQASINILNCHQTEKLKDLYKQMLNLKQNIQNYDTLNHEIKEIVRYLHFFKELRKEVIKSVFEMEYEIVEVEEHQTIIENNSEVKHVYVILNGSVTKKNYNESEDTQIEDTLEPPEFLSTLFDGEIFGLPSKTHDQYLHYSITTIQKSLLMRFPYSSYRLALSSNQNIEDRVQLLKQLFPNSSGRFKLTKQDYQSIAYQMQTLSFSSQEIIIREGESRDELMIVAHGNANICFQSVIQRKKLKVNPLCKKRQGAIKIMEVSSLKRSNLANYEVLFQNQHEIHYYFSQPSETKIRGDVLNWKGFSGVIGSDENQPKSQNSFGYSLMSMHNNTKIYLLLPEKVAGLSEHIRDKITEVAFKNAPKESIKRNQDNLNKWQAYKIKICSDILKLQEKKLY